MRVVAAAINLATRVLLWLATSEAQRRNLDTHHCPSTTVRRAEGQQDKNLWCKSIAEGARTSSDALVLVLAVVEFSFDISAVGRKMLRSRLVHVVGHALKTLNLITTQIRIVKHANLGMENML